jgi:pimeloyl-ACP methyl ester carboxylesterase
MRPADYSRYRNPQQALDFLTQWNQQLQRLTQHTYLPWQLSTDWGATVVWVHTPKRRIYETLVFFADFHTTALTWEINQNLSRLKANYRLCLVEINGQPNLSEGHSPELATDAYGVWASQVLQQLGRGKVTLVGHGLGALICLKTGRLAPELVKQAILLNPVGLHSPALSYSLLRYYWLVLKRPSPDSVRDFLREAVFSAADEALSPASERLLIDYQMHAFTQFQPASWWPQALTGEELETVSIPLYLVLGAQDRLQPYQASLSRAITHLRSMRSVFVLPTMGHGFQTSTSLMPILEGLLRLKP